MITKNIKREITVGMVVLLLAISSPLAKAQSKVDTMLASKQPINLSLPPQKIAALKTALSNPTERLLAIMNDSRLSPKQKQQLMIDISAKRQRAMDSLLTPDQKAAFIRQVVAARTASNRQTAGDSTKLNH